MVSIAKDAKRLAVLEAIMATIAWSFSGAFVKIINLQPTVLLFFRAIVPIILVLLWIKYSSEKFSKAPKWRMIAASTINAIRMILYFMAFQFTSIGYAVLILYSWPVFTIFWGSFILKERIKKRDLALLILAGVGIILLFSGRPVSLENKDFTGMLIMLISSLMYGFTIIIFKLESTRFSAKEIVLYQNLASAVIALPFFIVGFSNITLYQHGVSIIYSILIGFIGSLLFFKSLKILSAKVAARLTYLEAVFGVAIGVILFKESITWQLVFGGAIILLSCYLTTIDELTVKKQG